MEKGIKPKISDVNFKDFSYLKLGSANQKKVHSTLQKLGIFNHLVKYHPILVGTFPLNLNVDNSDLDIVCDFQSGDQFFEILHEAYKDQIKFKIERKKVKKLETILCNFVYDGFPIEVFGQNNRSHLQNGYRHMVIEARLLNIGGKKSFDEILKLKRMGMKTEPAFAKVFHIGGNPYEELLELENLSDEEIRRLLLKPR